MKGFKEFLMQGNVVELAVAVIIAGAFGKIVDALVKFLLNVIGSLGGNPNFDTVSVAVGGKQLYYGPVITAIIAFIAIAFVVYFAIVRPYEAIRARRRTDEPAAEIDEQVELLKEIRDELRARR